MKPVKLTLLASIITISMVSCAKENDPAGSGPKAAASPVVTATATPDEFASVRVIYKEQCSKCHGDSGDGGQVTVDGKKLKVPSLKGDHALKHKDEDFVDQIVNGGDGMPAFKGKLQPTEIDGLVKFVRKEIQKK